MSTLTSQDSDHFDLDYFHNKYNDHYSIMIRKVQPIQFKVINLNILPRQVTPLPSSQKSIYIDINITLKQVKQLKKIIPQSLIIKTTTISLLPFSLNYSTT
ncbi:3874_t:CDS:2 [Cetraspora pellucida]|uniref:3874_t:CDS:1 n=1 Tax=Cetraspora pellucida TaxID=1433469 RepID=A0A9N9G4U1_9GLOM|nr:3874_t:CDS:2 [Cetraspora pellucida]